MATSIFGGRSIAYGSLMQAIWMRVRLWTRRNVIRVMVAGSIIGVLGGLATGIAAGTIRTASAPARYTSAYGGDPDLLITQQSGRSLKNQIAQLPGVESIQGFVFVTAFLVAPTDGSLIFDPNPFAGDAESVGTRLTNGRFPDPTNPDEFVVNQELWNSLRETYGTQLGDVFSVRSFDQGQLEENFDPSSDPTGPTFAATLVGVTESPTDFDEPSQQVVFSPALLDVHSDVGVAQSLIAVQLRDGVDPAAIMDSVRQMEGGIDAFAVPTRIVSSSARRAVTFQTNALWFVSALTILAAAAVIAQVVGRTLRLDESERQSMLALGWRHSDFAAERSLEGLVVASIAAPITGVVAYAITGLFPIGILRLFEPNPGARMDWAVVIAGAAAVTTVVVATAVIIGHSRQRRYVAKSRGGLPAILAARGAPVALTVGSRFATSSVRGRSSWVSLSAGALMVAGLVGSTVVGMSLTEIVEQPSRWGVNYQTLFGNPYTYAEDDIIEPIAASPDVEAVTGINIGSVTINGSETATIGFDQAKGTIAPIVIDGRLPLVEGEIGVGAEVQRRIGAGVGDTVEVAGAEGEPRPFTIVGTIITPDSAGNGAAMIFDSLAALNPTATKNVALVDFRDGAPASSITRVSEIAFGPPEALITPTSVRALQRVTAAPYLLAIVFVFLAVLGCAYLLTTSARSRHRDFSILRALGSESSQLRAIMHWHATVAGVIALVVGIPVGIVGARLVVSLLTDALGIVPGARLSLLALSVVLVTTLAVANVLALLPARHAASNRSSRLSFDGQ